MSKFVAILIDGEITIHADRAAGNYDTLCGLDGNDPGIGHTAAECPKGSKINCSDCWAIWQAAQGLRARDFEAKIK